MKTFKALIRREVWEHGAIWMVPAVMSAVMVVLAIMASFGLVDEFPVEAIVEHDLDTGDLIDGLAAFNFAMAGWFLAVTSIVATFYLLDCLLADRKDRSILFWKSLPVSDLKTVLSKLFTAAVVFPLVAVAASSLTTLLLLLVGTVDLLIFGASPWELLWAHNPFFSNLVLILYGLIAMVLWYLPLMGYLMLISAFAKRAVMVWAVVPPIAIGLLESQLLGTRHVFELIGDRMNGFMHLAFDVDVTATRISAAGDMSYQLESPGLEAINMMPLLLSPGLWLGLLAAGGLIAGAVYLRRYGDDSA